MSAHRFFAARSLDRGFREPFGQNRPPKNVGARTVIGFRPIARPATGRSQAPLQADREIGSVHSRSLASLRFATVRAGRGLFAPFAGRRGFLVEILGHIRRTNALPGWSIGRIKAVFKPHRRAAEFVVGGPTTGSSPEVNVDDGRKLVTVGLSAQRFECCVEVRSPPSQGLDPNQAPVCACSGIHRGFAQVLIERCLKLAHRQIALRDRLTG